MRTFLLLLLLGPLALVAQTTADTSDYYYQIPDYPEDFTAGNVVSRMIDGLGFRFYWATEGLRPEDLAYRPTPEARSLYETLEHLYGLSEMIVNAPRGDTMVRPEDWSDLTYADLRQRTLDRLEAAGKLYRGRTAEELAEQRVAFSYGGRFSEFPLWNLINGPLADAIYHTGQVVTLRRISGHPIRQGVNVFRGSVRRDKDGK